MKSTNSPNGKIATVAIMLTLSLLVSNTIAVAQVFQIGNREYRFEIIVIDKLIYLHYHHYGIKARVFPKFFPLRLLAWQG